jgi:hypothetical protein
MKVTFAVQLCRGSKSWGQLLVWANGAPAEIDVMNTGKIPTLVIVTTCAEEFVPTISLPKFTLLGVNVR